MAKKWTEVNIARNNLQVNLCSFNQLRRMCLCRTWRKAKKKIKQIISVLKTLSEMCL